MRSFSPSILSLLGVMLLGVAEGSPQDYRGAINGSDSGGNTRRAIPTADSAENPLCKPYYDVRDAIMGGIFEGRCNDLARAAIRLAFHDAGTFSLQLQANHLDNGAADGSMLVFDSEVQRPDNNGLQSIVGALKPLPAQFNVTPGDVLHASDLPHLAGNLAVVACPGGPVVNTYVGRTPPKNEAPMDLLPSPFDPVPKLVARFADMGFSVRELMALIGAHTAGKQRFVDTNQAGKSFDSTADIWDVRFYSETQSASAAPGTFRLDSDVNFSHNATTVKDYNRFVGNQDDWAREYADAHEKMSLLGYDKETLTECTEVMPQMIDLKNLAVSSSNSTTDPTIDPAKLEAAIQQTRSIWLK
ncbi:heme peroxidase [Mycena capillaripes]|nr:heme peroxidase [Mycena capillaripes]